MLNFTLQCPFLEIFCACESISICVLRHMRHCWGCWRGIGGGTGDPSREPGGAQRPRQQMWPTVECAVLRYGMVFLIWHGMIMVWLVLLDVSLHVWWSCKVAVWYDSCVQCTWTTWYDSRNSPAMCCLTYTIPGGGVLSQHASGIVLSPDPNHSPKTNSCPVFLAINICFSSFPTRLSFWSL